MPEPRPGRLRSRRELEIFVESLPAFRRPKLRLEQYPTDAAAVATAAAQPLPRPFIRQAPDARDDAGLRRGHRSVRRDIRH